VDEDEHAQSFLAAKMVSNTSSVDARSPNRADVTDPAERRKIQNRLTSRPMSRETHCDEKTVTIHALNSAAIMQALL
jgi:hypothetical protein